MSMTASIYKPIKAEVCVAQSGSQWIWLHDKSGNRIDIHADDEHLDMIVDAIAAHKAQRQQVRDVLGEISA